VTWAKAHSSGLEIDVHEPQRNNLPDVTGGGGSFVGRHDEIAILGAALGDVCRGCGQSVVIVGEPGVGKTRLAEETAALAGQQGAIVRWGRCWEGDGAPPLWPWMQALRGQTLAQNLTDANSVVGIAGLDVESIQADGGSDTISSSLRSLQDHEAQRIRLFDAVSLRLRGFASDQPLVVVLDDLHRADDLSLRLLHYLAATTGDAAILLVGTYRDTDVGRGQEAPEALRSMVAQSRCILLRGLNASDTIKLAENIAGTLPIEVASGLYERTAGNPFFVGELVRLIGLPETEAAHFRIPHGVQEAIRIRVSRLSPACRSVLTVASVMGRDFNRIALQAVADVLETKPITNGVVLEQLDEAAQRGLLLAISGNVYRFVHSLVREAIYEDLPLTLRVRLHRAIGEALERLHSQNLDPHSAVLAHHFVQGAADGCAGKAIEYLAKAAEQFASSLDYEQAITYYEQALRLCDEGACDADDQRRCRILSALGEAQQNCGQRALGRDTLLKAAEIARRLDANLLARIALAYCGPREWDPVVDHTGAALLQEALRCLPNEDSIARALVMSQLANATYYAAERPANTALMQSALAMAQRLAHPLTSAVVLCDAHFTLLGSPDLEQRLRLARAMVTAAETAASKEWMVAGQACVFQDQLQLGDVAGADAAFHLFERYAHELRQPFSLYRAAVIRTMRLLLNGRFDEAEAAAFEAFAAGQRAQSRVAELSLAVHLWTLRRDQGRLPELTDVVLSFVERFATVPATRAALALMYAEIGDLAPSRVQFECLAANHFSDLPREVNYVNCLDLLAQACALLGDTERAALLYELLLPYSQQVVVIGFGEACHGAVARSLGLLARTLGRWVEAGRHFEDAIAINTRLGAGPYLARTYQQYAELLLHMAESPADKEGEIPKQDIALQHKGFRLLDDAIRLYRHLGMTVHADKVVAIRYSAQQRVEAAAAAIGRLSAIFKVDGGKCTVGWAGEQSEIRGYTGARLIALLLQSPNVPRHVLDLDSAANYGSETNGNFDHMRRGDGSWAAAHLSPTPSHAGDVVLDGQARREYRRRLEDLREELHEAHRCNDLGRIARLKTEQDQIEQELTHVYRDSSATEKARKRVRKNVRETIEKIRPKLPGLANHLTDSLQTGTTCVYAPKQKVSWQL